jgi:radical SAM superfamily enzyme YgiQ (UPF0313 family)
VNVLFVHGLVGFSLAEWCLRDALGRQHDLPAAFHSFEVTTDDFEQQESLRRATAALRPELVGFSCHAWTIELYRRAASWVKQLSPRTRVVFGGPQVSSVPAAERLLRDCPMVDFVVRGPGELGLARLVRALAGQAQLDTAPGLSRRSDSGLLHRPAARHQDWSRKVIFHHGNRLAACRLEGLLQMAYETVRGCSRGCLYCVYPGEGLGLLDEQLVRQELEFILSFRIPHLRICDAHFGATAARAKALLRSLARLNRGTSIKIYPALEHVDAEYLALAEEAGAEITSVGIQSTNPAALRSVRRVPAHPHYEAIRLILKRFPETPADLIVGLPGDDLEGLRRSFQDVLELGFCRINAFRLTLFPATPLADEANKHFAEADLQLSSTGQVLSSRGLPAEQQPAVATLVHAAQVAAPLRRTRGQLTGEASLFERLARHIDPGCLLGLSRLLGEALPTELLQELPALLDRLRPAIGDHQKLRDGVIEDVFQLLRWRCQQARRRGLFWSRGRIAELVTVVVAKLGSGEYLVWDLARASIRREPHRATLTGLRGPHVLHLTPLEAL